jgi:WS/DGAT/MGAT family acyltransferase
MLPHLMEQASRLVPGGPELVAGLRRVRRLGRQPSDLIEAPSTIAPRTSLNGRISPHRRFAFGTLDLDKVKSVKTAAGVTVNDVIVTVCAAALREWLLSRDDLPEQPLVAAIPISVRTGAEGYGNRISMLITPIPTDESDPAARLKSTHESLKAVKERHQAVPASILTDSSIFIPPAVAGLASRTTLQVVTRLRPAINLVISNMPGPREPLYCAGARLEGNFPISALLDGVGLNITVSSYRDQMDVGIIGDRERVDDAWELLDGMRQALAELLAAQQDAESSTPRTTER